MLADRTFAELFGVPAAAKTAAEAQTNPRASTLLPVKVVADEAVLSCACAELSRGGIRLRASRPLSVGAQVELEIALPGEPATVHGVVRGSEVDEQGLDVVAVQFTSVSARASAAIEAHRAATARRAPARFSA